ncbi:FlgK family flagellar hook-associated protein, partial [Candidatus Megaera venefica]|uniref:FlgK family flagellar hook-associated protein n=1 Tax=Candidatus Megaera venefica TaxID=2055910 RepID=UPI002AD4D0FF
MSESVRQTLSLVREQIDVGARNLELVGDPNARRITTSLTVDQIGGSKAHRTSLSESRSVSILQERAYVEQVTKLGNNNTYTEFLSDLQSVIGGEKDPQVSRLVKTIDSFFAQAKILESSSGHSMRQAFINKAEEVSAAITGASKKVTDLRFDADKRLKQSAHSASGIIKALFNLNQQMLISSSPIRLHDKRDQLVRELAHNFDIKASYGASGTVSIQAKSSGELIVASDYYSQFSYDGVGSIDAIIENNDYPPLMITQFGRDGKETHSKVFIGGSDDSTMSVSGGQWSALIDLRDKILPETGDKIKALGSNFANKLNAIHNNGSPFPPKDYFKSSIDISRGQDLEWGDPFTIHFVSKEGNQLLGGAGRLNPATIDMRSLASTALSGKATIADLIKELNEKLDLAPSRPRAAIGAITDGVGVGGVQIPGEYLLNNIQLRARGPVNPADGNSFTFDLDLQGSSHFGSNIEILEARSEDIGGANQQVVATDQLPGSFRLEKDTNTATGQNIKVQGATAPRIITLRVRITGDNGVVSEGTVSFPVNPAAVVNDRLAFDGATTGAFNPVPLTSHSGVARAKLVDDNGIEIDPNSGQSG